MAEMRLDANGLTGDDRIEAVDGLMGHKIGVWAVRHKGKMGASRCAKGPY